MVEKILEELSLPVNPFPGGYDLGYDLGCEDRVLLVRGSGIAGAARSFRLVTKRGVAISERVRTKREIRRILLEWMTGEPKVEAPGYTCYARRHHYQGNDSVIWVHKKIRLPKPKRNPSK